MNPSIGSINQNEGRWLPRQPVLSLAREYPYGLIDIRALNGYSSGVGRKFLTKISSLGWEEAVRNRWVLTLAY
jgi:hypothetical protein